jgi:glycosyltransferase involved in cell wall biosynthesis
MAGIDSVYFLMFNGWQSELRSNRWHYAARWSRELPVVLVQPSIANFESRWNVVADRRLPGAEILNIPRDPGPFGSFLAAVRQARDIVGHMRSRSHERPLLWIYNPRFAVTAALVPAVGRVLHATENYFDFEGMDDQFRRQTESLISLADLTVAVSEGVAKAYAPLARGKLLTVTNGCDWKEYSGAFPDSAMREHRGSFERLAVYAGNINSRIDFTLLESMAESNPNMLLVLIGPADIQGESSAAWDRIIGRANVRYFGPLPAERLPAIYAAADVGFVPYSHDRLIVENGFPLKIFEMIAAGLPVVASKMRPLAPHAAPWLSVCDDSASFLGAVRTLSRASLDEAARRAMRAAAREQDYDKKFDTVQREVAQIVGRRSRPETAVPTLLLSNGAEWDNAMAGIDGRLRYGIDLWAVGLSRLRGSASTIIKLVPERIKRQIFRWLGR